MLCNYNWFSRLLDDTIGNLERFVDYVDKFLNFLHFFFHHHLLNDHLLMPDISVAVLFRYDFFDLVVNFLHLLNKPGEFMQPINYLGKCLVECHNFGHNSINSYYFLGSDGYLHYSFNFMDFRNLDDLINNLLYHVWYFQYFFNDPLHRYYFIPDCFNFDDPVLIVRDLISDHLDVLLNEHFLHDSVLLLYPAWHLDLNLNNFLPNTIHFLHYRYHMLNSHYLLLDQGCWDRDLHRNNYLLLYFNVDVLLHLEGN